MQQREGNGSELPFPTGEYPARPKRSGKRVNRGKIAGLLVHCLAGSFKVVHSQDSELRYRAEQLNCARFFETADSRILTQSGGRGREQTTGRTAVWQFQAAPEASGVALVGWLDSLALWRRSAETIIRPDTDGLIGGRYRGALSPKGAYGSKARPFVPDEVAEVAGMGSALDDFFPPLAPGKLKPGQGWSDSAVTIRRLPDSALSGVLLYQFAVEARRSASSAEPQGDTLPLPLQQTSLEHGTYVWHPSLGLLRRERRIVVQTIVPASRSVPWAVRSRIEQRITVERDLNVPPHAEGSCKADSTRESAS
jgi:hypothetical protein